MTNRGRPLIYSPEICDRLADMFADGSSIVQVCANKLKIARSMYYEWKERYPEFKAAADAGEDISQAYHEQRLADGADGMIDNFSAPARIFLMKSRFRRDYGEQKDEKSAGDTLLEQIVLGNVKLTKTE